MCDDESEDRDEETRRTTYKQRLELQRERLRKKLAELDELLGILDEDPKYARLAELVNRY